MPDPPPSPTPSKRKTRSLQSDAHPSIARHVTQLTPRVSEKINKALVNDDTPIDAVPMASSEDDYESSSVQPSSSDFTITTPFKVHDWSSLDLPPSSPPPPSSPALPAAYDSDLPCSDIPSSDFDFGDTPSSTAEVDKDNASAAPTPQESTEEPSLAIFDGMNFAGMSQFISDWDFSDFDSNAIIDDSQDGTAADEALEAIRNGMGQEDFSEAWNLLNSVLLVPSDSADAETTATTGSDLHPFGQSSDTTLSSEPDTGFGGIDYANLVASNFEDLLKGCLV